MKIKTRCQCKNIARFKIMDIVCPIENGSIFWICEDCVKLYIVQDKLDPHYIILGEK